MENSYSIEVGGKKRPFKVVQGGKLLGFGIVTDRPVPRGTTYISWDEYIIGTLGKKAYAQAVGNLKRIDESCKSELIIKGTDRVLDYLPNPSTKEYKKIIEKSKEFAI